jgi:ATP-dependent protease ClpP protease subunit
MSDLVARLREFERALQADEMWHMPKGFLGGTADEIERLTREREEWRAQVFRMTETITEWRHKSERLRAALADLLDNWSTAAVNRAREALRGAGETKDGGET